MNLAGKRIAVTGSAGYIGQNLVTALAASGADVVQLDLEYGVDIADKYQWDYRLDGVTHIVHLAAISGIAACEEDPQRATLTNVAGTFSLVEHASEVGIPVIFASSQAAANPNGVYAMGKSMCEDVITAANDEIINPESKHKVLRFANIFGGGGYLNKKTSVVAQFIKGAVNDGVIYVNGDGEQARDFVSIGVVIDTIVKIIERKGVGFPDVIDVGTGRATKIVDLAEIVLELTPFDVEIKHVDSRSVGVASSVANPEALIANGVNINPGALKEYLTYIFSNLKR